MNLKKSNNMKYALYILLALCTTACSKDDKSDCPSDLACTEIFVSIGAKVQNSKNEDILLSKTTTQIEGKTNIITKTNFDPVYSYYVILDDSSLEELIKEGSTVTFKGYDTNNQLLFTEKYTIGHDCCHVVKLSGKDNIIVD